MVKGASRENLRPASGPCTISRMAMSALSRVAGFQELPQPTRYRGELQLFGTGGNERSARTVGYPGVTGVNNGVLEPLRLRHTRQSQHDLSLGHDLQIARAKEIAVGTGDDAHVVDGAQGD